MICAGLSGFGLHETLTALLEWYIPCLPHFLMSSLCLRPEFLNHVLFCASVRLLLALAQLVLTPPWCLVCSISAVWTMITPHCLACRALWHHSRHRAPDHGVKWTRTRQELEGDWDKGSAIVPGLFFSTVPFFPLKLTQQYQEYLLHL